MTDRWPNLMKAATARAYLDMGARKFRAEVLPHLTPRTVGQRVFYRRRDLDRFSDGALDGAALTVDRRNATDWLEAVDNDLAARPRR